MGLRLGFSALVTLWLCVFTPLLTLHPEAAQDANAAALVRVADAIMAWDGQRPGDLFLAVKQANPDKAAIVSMRELNKAEEADGDRPVDAVCADDDPEVDTRRGTST